MFYPSKINMLIEEENHHKNTSNDSWNTNHFMIFAFNDEFHHVLTASDVTDLNMVTHSLVTIGFASCTLFLTTGPNVARKRLLDFQSGRLEAQVHRSR